MIFFVSYTSGWGIDGVRLQVRRGFFSGKSSHVVTRDFPTERQAKQYARCMGYIA